MDNLKRIRTLADEMLRLKDGIEQAEIELKAMKDACRKIEELDLPELMDEVGMSEFKMGDGRVISIENKVYASIPKDRQDEAFSWLRKRKLDGIIKRTITVVFGKGEDKKARHVERNLHRYKSLVDNSIVSSETIHPQTLKAFARKALEDGMDIPLDAFGIFEKRVASVK